MCSLNKIMFLNGEFPLPAVRILAGKTSSFFDLYFLCAHSRFCCLVSRGSRAKLFTCEKVVSPARVSNCPRFDVSSCCFNNCFLL